MKHVTVPPPVPLIRLSDGVHLRKTEPDGKLGEPATLDFFEFLLERFMDQKCVANVKEIMRNQVRIKIVTDGRDASAGVLAFEDSDYEFVTDLIKNPSPNVAYDPRTVHNLIPHFQAWENATAEDPRQKSANGEAVAVEAAHG